MKSTWIRVPLLIVAVMTVSRALVPARAQQLPPPKDAVTMPVISAADLEEDAEILRRAYETLHPGLYRYNTKPQMDSAFDELNVKLDHDESLQDAYLAFSLFAAKIKCGHTYPNFFNQPKSVADVILKANRRLPFYFEWIDRSMVITSDFTTNKTLPRGTEVSEIDGVDTSVVLSTLIKIARADGSNDAKRVALLGVNGDDLFETFDVYYPMFFHLDSPKVRLVIRRPGGTKMETTEVNTLTYEQRIAPIKHKEEDRQGGTDVQFEWKYLAGGAAYLRMPNWALYSSKWDWSKWLGDRLDELADKKSPALIIDLRGNEGGLDVGNVILSRLVHKDLPLVQMKRLVRCRQVPSDLAPYLDTWDPSFKDWGAAVVPLAAPWPTAPPVNYLKLTKYDDDAAGDEIRSEGKQFLGRVIVLVDSTNSSATFQFAQIVQQNRLGMLVGEPTGGSQRGINGGAFFFLRLPKSHIEMDIPLIGTFPATERPDAGLTPDVAVKRTRDSIAADHDVVLDAAIKLLQ